MFFPFCDARVANGRSFLGGISMGHVIALSFGVCGLAMGEERERLDDRLFFPFVVLGGRLAFIPLDFSIEAAKWWNRSFLSVGEYHMGRSFLQGVTAVRGFVLAGNNNFASW
jgi:hypothetical protein